MSRLRGHGLILVLLALVTLFSILTWTPQPTVGAAGADALADSLSLPAGTSIVVFAGQGPDEEAFAQRLKERLAASNWNLAGVVRGQPFDGLEWLESRRKTGDGLNAIAVSTQAAGWTYLGELPTRFPNWAGLTVHEPPRRGWPSYLLAENLRNILSQIAIIALLAIGMTLVIATGGIDLSVGSLLALSAMISALLIRDFGGDGSATPLSLVVCSGLAILVCGFLGLLTGLLITVFRLPPFIATLGMMWMARGMAFKAGEGRSIRIASDSFAWLSHGSLLPGLPNLILFVAVFYVIGFLLLNRTVLGRYILAVGSNARASLLSGVPIRTVLVFVYVASATLAGLGGIAMASQLQSGDPKLGPEYELLAITAVVVGGTSLRGGQARMFGTFLGALLISVVQMGMNQIHVSSYDQMIIVGAILLVAVLIDIRRERSRV